MHRYKQVPRLKSSMEVRRLVRAEQRMSEDVARPLRATGVSMETAIPDRLFPGGSGAAMTSSYNRVGTGRSDSEVDAAK